MQPVKDRRYLAYLFVERRRNRAGYAAAKLAKTDQHNAHHAYVWADSVRWVEALICQALDVGARSA